MEPITVGHVMDASHSIYSFVLMISECAYEKRKG
jgi:hypothetical protein